MFPPVPPIDNGSAILAEAAFGGIPGLAAAELPVAHDALGSWHRAVVLGGQGRYAAARAELRCTEELGTDLIVRSLAASTAGSLLRQLGWHVRAAVADGQAAALVLPLRADRVVAQAGRRGPDRVEAACDALTGLAADALGAGRLALADRLLRRSRAFLDSEQTRWRAWIRWHWVAAETALAAGSAELAGTHAAAALALAEQAPSVRHRVKSRLLVAAAAAAADEAERCRALAELVAAECHAHDLLPLGWANAMLRAGVATGAAAADAIADAAGCAEVIARRGGRFRPAGLP